MRAAPIRIVAARRPPARVTGGGHRRPAVGVVEPATPPRPSTGADLS
ncbi:hypothetical protein [Micromonospora sp. NPDC005174]